VLIDDALQRLGKARLSLDLARDLLTQGSAELTTASARIAAAAVDLRIALATPRLNLIQTQDFAIPEFSMDGLSVLDVGCGNGHALAYPHFERAKERVGIDVDSAAIAEGSAKFPAVKLMYGSAEKIPLPDQAYDVVMSRVALLYTDIRVAIGEIDRVMKPGGHLFITMHDWRHYFEFLGGAIKMRALRRVLDHAYIAGASAVFAATGKVPTRPGRDTRETFQTEGGMRRELKRAGFSDIRFSRSPRHWRIAAVKGEGSRYFVSSQQQSIQE
jgi:ubiquinone/menaquinone biosynthesis C-methylase UbiE